jgi:hypothetical protein
MATGLIVGESLMGVVYAGLVAGAERAGSENSADVLAVVSDFPWAGWLGGLLFAALIAGLYLWTRARASDPGIAGPDAGVPVSESYR